MVKEELDKLHIEHGKVELGEVEVKDTITAEQRADLKSALHKSGFILMDDPKSILIEKVINLVIDMVHNTDQMPDINYSDYISQKLNYDFKYLSRIFSDARGMTIENYIIAHKIERAKELILYNELSLTEISYKLNYSSVAHLSNQFKKVTGLTPSYFKQMKHKKRISLEMIGVDDD
jgi:AraC-like DNA-binding protein